MRERRTAIVVAVFCAVGCQPAARGERTASTAPAASSCKPEAPVTVEVEHRALDHETLEVTVRATPQAPAEWLEVGLVLPAHARAMSPTIQAFGATPTGQTRSFVTIVRVDERPSELASFARIPVADLVMSRATHVAIGRPPALVSARVYPLPDGELVREVQQ